MDINVQVLQKNNWDHVHYSGPINEDSELHLAPLVKNLGPSCVFNFRQVAFVNSCGVRAWINFMREVEKKREIIFEECIPEIVMQMNMIPSFKGSAKVKSVFGSYGCENCGHQQMVLFEDGRNMPSGESVELPPVKCEKCGQQMEMEELEDEFFAFLQA
jgi:anti-anti-sigma regulatory factor